MSTVSITFGGNVLTVGGNALSRTLDPYNPLYLQPYTMRFKFYDTAFDPSAVQTPSWPSSATWTRVLSTPDNVWDFCYQNPDWSANNENSSIFYALSDEQSNAFDVLGANTSDVTNMAYLFSGSELSSVALFDTSNVLHAQWMFSLNRVRLTSVPEFDFSSATNVACMFYYCDNLVSVPDFAFTSAVNAEGICTRCLSISEVPEFTFGNTIQSVANMFLSCYNVESGALPMYQYLSAFPSITIHDGCFGGCGRDTASGVADLEQIPESWGGRMSPVDPYNPLNLPPYTIRLKFKDGVTPSFSQGTAVQVSSSPDNVWDLTYQNATWDGLCFNQSDLLEVLGANATSVTSMIAMFINCSSLTTVPLFDTSSVTSMFGMFSSCTALTEVPLFDTSSVTDMGNMFSSCTALTTVPLFDTGSVTKMSGMFSTCMALTTVPLFNTSSLTDVSTAFRFCYNVESGALALYNQMAGQATPPSSHTYCFQSCGSNTVSGSAELAQIPSGWK